MTLALTTAVTTGDLDTVNYGEVEIVEFSFDVKESRISMIVEHGNTVTGEWVPASVQAGPTERRRFLIANRGQIVDSVGTVITSSNPAFDVISAKNPQVGDTTYESTRRDLYQWLIDEGHFSGTISV